MKSLFLGFILTASTCSAFAEAAEPVVGNQQTLSIIKPDAVAANHIGEIIARFEKNGLRIDGIKMVSLSKDQAQQFYAVHIDHPFFNTLTTFMSSGPVVAIVLEGDNAIAKNREMMGPFDFTKAAPGTIRADFAQSIKRNAVHGSDSPEAAREEIAFFFQPNEVFVR
ncbi:MAG TPA: nucleoside-diphosphate kinase [Parachlamydiaceae bacterium]|nr:nucleoside-diphosphate kinase [Parachlamydiaceae bacterium]